MENNKVRILNGYRVVYKPNHPKAMTNANWNGWIYEHIYIAEKKLKRPIADNEVVHHLDFDRSNNRIENLLVIDRGMHSRLHVWLDKGAPGWQQPGTNRVNSGKPKLAEQNHCSICDMQLQRDQAKYCSDECAKLASRKVERPSYQQLLEDKNNMSMEAVGKKYGVSSNAVRKWIKDYANKAILSQAEDTSSEGAETSGEVKSS